MCMRVGLDISTKSLSVQNLLAYFCMPSPLTQRITSQHIFEVAKAFHINVMPLLSSQKTPLEKAKREGSGGENLNLNLNSKRIERGTTSRTDNKPVIYHARNWREIQAKLLS